MGTEERRTAETHELASFAESCGGRPENERWFLAGVFSHPRADWNHISQHLPKTISVESIFEMVESVGPLWEDSTGCTRYFLMPQLRAVGYLASSPKELFMFFVDIILLAKKCTTAIEFASTSLVDSINNVQKMRGWSVETRSCIKGRNYVLPEDYDENDQDAFVECVKVVHKHLTPARAQTLASIFYEKGLITDEAIERYRAKVVAKYDPERYDSAEITRLVNLNDTLNVLSTVRIQALGPAAVLANYLGGNTP